MTSSELRECSDEASNVAEVLTEEENAKGETQTRGLFLVASALYTLSAIGYEIAAILAEKNETKGKRI